jgi:succinyl-CoA synthetase alpha subunit
MVEIKTRILKNQYHDSVALMLASRTLRESEGVVDAALIMGTGVNKELLKQGGLLTPEGEKAQANDLIITVKCEAGASALLDEAEALLKDKAERAAESDTSAKSVRSALIKNPDLNLAVISVAGAYAAREAREALAGGLHVLLFSDNVSLEDEISLKKLALHKGLLLMGPGAGTAIINGVGLGFANAVPRGNVGIVSAAGTGLQEVSTLAVKHGAGISQAIGTGGRDLSKAVGGLTFFAAVDALMADPATGVLALVSKPPDSEVTQRLIEKLRGSKKKVVLCLLGAEVPDEKIENLIFTRMLEECALAAAGVEVDIHDKDLQPVITEWKGRFTKKQRFIRGLFSGGTLCYEAQVIWKEQRALCG